MKVLKTVFCLIMSLLFLLISGCGTSDGDNGDNKITIAVSIVPEETFARAVCGDLVDIVTLVPPGYSPGSYEPTAELMEKFSDASIYF